MGKKEFTFSSFDGTKLRGIIWSVDNPVAVIQLVHGHGEHIERYDSVAAFFNRNNVAFVASDLRGHGKSQGKKGYINSLQDFLGDVDALYEQVAGEFSGVPYFIMGHSMGGGIVLQLLMRENTPYTGAIVSSPWLELVPEPDFFQKTTALIGDKLLPKLTDHTKLDPKFISSIAEEQRKYAEDPLIHDMLSGRLFGEMNRAGAMTLSNGSQIKLPVLLSHGLDDEVTSSEASKRLSELSDNFELNLWEGVRHEGHNDIEAKNILESYWAFIERNIQPAK